MVTLNERYLVDADGNRVGVVLDMETYRQLLDELEELESTRMYDEGIAVVAEEGTMPLEEAIAEIERRGSTYSVSPSTDPRAVVPGPARPNPLE